jgi:AcrR family transcriptional regulator
MPRTYTKRVRASKEAATHERILLATLELWRDAGPAATTITGVAAKAGVQRLTLYRHFGDDAVLAAAAWERFDRDAAPPDPAKWAAIVDPSKRLRRALRTLYRHYAAHADVLEPVLRDAPRVSGLDSAVHAHERYLDGVVATIENGWTPRGKSRGRMLTATFAHAIRFETWRSLAASGLDERESARLFERLVRALAKKSAR